MIEKFKRIKDLGASTQDLGNQENYYNFKIKIN